MVMFSFLILGAAFVFLGRSYVISEYRDNMVSNAEEVSHAAQALVRDGELSNWDLRMVISTLAQSTGNHIFITDTDGTIVSCSCRNIACEHLGRSVGSAQLTQLRSDGKFNLITNLGGFYASPHYVVAQPITIGTDARVIGYVFVATNSATIIDGWRTFVWVFLAASAAVMMIALLLSLVTSKRMAQPLDEMAVAAKKFAHGDFSARVTDDGRTDEVGALISAFNTMADSLETSEQRRNAFIANVSHELKTPLASIRLLSDSISQSADMDSTTMREFVADIGSEAERLQRTTEKLLDLSRRDDGVQPDVTIVDLQQAVHGTLHLLRPLADRSSVTITCLMSEGVTVRASEDDIYHIVFNLVENAIKYNRPGGAVRVTLQQEKQTAVLRITDTGPGIPADCRESIFQPFFRVDKSRSREMGGVGLGLALVREIAVLHGGSVTVESSSENGTTFSVTLPLAQRC